MSTDAGIRLGIEGEREFKRQIKEINSNLKELASETKVVTSEFIGNEHSVEALTASNRQLGETSAALASKIELLRARLDKYREAGQLSSDAAQKLQINLNNTTAAFNANEAKIRANNAELQELAKAERKNIGGEQEFERQIKEVNSNLSELASKTKVVTSEYIGNEHSVEALTASNRQLGETSEGLASKIEILRARLNEYGASGQLASDAAKKLQIELNNTTAAYNTNEARIKANNDELQALTESQDANAESVGGLGGLMQALGVNVDGVTRSLGLSKEQTTALSEAMGGGGMSLAVGATIAIGVLVLFAKAVKEITEFMAEAVVEATDYADNIATLSTNFHIAADTLQEYQYMAELTDTSLDTITGSISKLTRSMDKARDGNQEVDAAFAALNVRVTDANGELRDASEVFLEVIDGLGRIHNETERDAVSMAIFGRSAMDLNSLIAIGSAGIRGFAEEARAMGYVLSDEEVAALAQLDDEFVRFDNQMTAIKNQIAAEMAPALIELAQQLLDVAQTVDWQAFGSAAASVIRDLTPMIIDLANAIAAAARALTELFSLTGGGSRSDSYPGRASRSSADFQTARAAAQQHVTLQLDGYTVGKATTPYVNQQNYSVGKIL